MEKDAAYIAFGLLAASAAKFLLSAWIRNKRLERFVRIGMVSDLVYYPVKSCQGIPLESGTLLPLGLYKDGMADRNWMFTRPDGSFLSQRQCPKMALIKVSSHDDMIHLDAPGMPTLQLPKCPKVDPRRFIACRVWGLPIPGMDCGEEANQWACDFLGQENLHVVFSAPSMKKKIISDECLNPWTDLVRPEDESIFSDLTSYLVATDKSLEAVNKRLDKPVSMRNFRPNIVVDTTMEAFDEDLWGELMFGDNVYMRCLHPCPRCILPTVDPDTGKKDSALEPYKTLEKFRCKPGYGEAPFFGINAAVDFPADIRVGDPVYARYP
ncbi:mitochondrial amidoxime reducing component 2-like isoform X2 [Mizuhopecten yessoensis]|uniref:mitochondrial amidoxime reducing component 2-like isoform X2 n=1 Tax=Mizuhopecten yessoensis TaxID=6573 RepID=UPI000B4578AD|nr:mitochondrial amidoxime reducing component 2-like isoform X2 [Mizuhopecten yessoensis]